jgi:hypothetical protein
MKQKNKTPKQRNPYVQHLVSKTGNGAHMKSKKSQRQQDKINLRKQGKDYFKNNNNVIL